MKTKLLKKLRRKFSKKYTVQTVVCCDGSIFRIYDEGLYLFSSYNSEDLNARLRELYYRYLEDYVTERRKRKTRLTYWW